jgi:hypothetical protein
MKTKKAIEFVYSILQGKTMIPLEWAKPFGEIIAMLERLEFLETIEQRCKQKIEQKEKMNLKEVLGFLDELWYYAMYIADEDETPEISEKHDKVIELVKKGIMWDWFVGIVYDYEDEDCMRIIRENKNKLLKEKYSKQDKQKIVKKVLKVFQNMGKVDNSEKESK